MIAVVVGGLVVVNLVAQGSTARSAADEPSGATARRTRPSPTVSPAFATLLTHYGHDVNRHRGPIVDRLACARRDRVRARAQRAHRRRRRRTPAVRRRAGGRLVDRRRGAVLPAQPARPAAGRGARPASTSWTDSRPDARQRRARSRPRGSGRGRRPAAAPRSSAPTTDALLTDERVGQRRDLLPRRRVAARERVPRHRPTTPRSRSGSRATRPAGGVRRRRARLRREPRARPRSPIAGRSRCSSSPSPRSRSSGRAPPLRATRPPRPRAAPGPRRVRDSALSISLERTHDPATRSRPRSSGHARASRRAPDSGPNADDEELDHAARSLGCTPNEIARAAGTGHPTTRASWRWVEQSPASAADGRTQ